jgi:hypothetical protein
MKQRLFGQAICADDVVRLPAEAGASALVRLAGALISRGIEERVGKYTFPEITERPSVPDGGVDAECTTPENLPGHETGGLIGPGRTVFQFKFRDATRADRKSLLRELSRCLREEFPRVASACDRYVLMTNLQLSGAERKKLREAALGSWPAFTGNPLVIWGAEEIALSLNSAADLRHLFFADSGPCTLDIAATGLGSNDETPLASGALKAKAPSEFVSMLLRLVVQPHTNYSIDWELGQAIEPLRDRDVLLGFAREAGVEGARLIAANLDPEKQGFWPLAADLLAALGHDERVEGRLLARLGSGSWSGSPVSMIERRIEGAKSLLSHEDAKVVTWARQALADLNDWRQRALGEDREEWIWDYRIGRAALEEMLARKDSPERLWAIGRLLEDAPLDRVRKLLTRTDILDALPKLQHLDEGTRSKWEQWARSGSDPR